MGFTYRDRLSLFPSNVFNWNSPHRCSSLFEYTDGFPGSKNGGHTRRKSASTAFCHVVMAQRPSVSDVCFYLFVRNT